MANKGGIGYNVREATPGDYEAVIAIGENIDDKYDYMFKRYHTYLRDPRRISLVLEIAGKVVSMSQSVYQKLRNNI